MTALTQGALGEALMAAGRYMEAEPLLRSSYLSLKESQTAENTRLATSRRRLVDLYTSWKRPDKLADIGE